MTRQASSSFYLDNDDLRFQLSRLDWATIVQLQEDAFNDADSFKDATEARQFYEDVFVQVGEFIAKEIAPHEAELDEQHPIVKDNDVVRPKRIEKITDELHRMGVLALTIPRRLGGSNAPLLVQQVITEMMTRADASVVAEYGFHGGIGQALMFYSIEEGSAEVKDGVPVKTRFDDVVRRIAQDGEWGAMVLTEPQAGSDLAKLQARAVPVDAQNERGLWKLTGQKIFITAGHGDHHLVIARTEDETKVPGLKGLSIFYVPRFVDAHGKRAKRTDTDARKNFVIGGVEHKMGQHSAVAATIHYEESFCELMGRRGDGFAYMLTLMNNARVAVAMEAIGTCEAAYRMAKAFAQQRVSMGKPIAEHEMIADYLDEMEVALRGLRAVTFEAAYHEEVYNRLRVQIKLRPSADPALRQEHEKRLKRHGRKARHLTPLIKYFGGEECVRQARMCMQIMGGIGYVKETGAEKLLRDALVIPVYEGTSQIQSLMALKDNLQGVIRNPARFLSEVARARLEALSPRDGVERGEAKIRSYALSGMQNIVMRIAADKLGDVRGRPMTQWRKAFMKDWDPQRDFAYGMLHAERLTKLLCYSAIAKTLVRQAQQAKGTADEADRMDLAARFIDRFEPRARGVLIEIESMGPSVLNRVLGKKKPKTREPVAKAAE